MASGDREPSRADNEPSGEDRDPAGADRVNALERRCRRFLRVYPAAYRRERAEEIIGTLLEATPRAATGRDCATPGRWLSAACRHARRRTGSAAWARTSAWPSWRA